MIVKILVTIFIFGVLAGCSKSGSNAKPVLKFKSVSANVVPQNGTLTFNFDATDNEGDLTLDTIFLKKVRINRRIVPTITSRDSFFIKVPTAPATSTGSIQLDLTYQNYLVTGNPPAGTSPENDTLLFKFALLNKAKHVSDTFTSEPIVIIRN